ncbi:MAG: tetratricopeptide repeat protein [Acidobacteriota bacterium]
MRRNSSTEPQNNRVADPRRSVPRSPTIESPDSHLGRRFGVVAVLALVVSCCLVYANGLRGDFVYDDLKQIVENHLIQENRHLGEALTSDVWAFKGDRGEPWSNFWRPAFVAWLTLCHRPFGLDDTLGWHLGSLLLHILVCLLARRVALRLGLGEWTALGVAWIFAVHPVHVESVTWISGSPDLLVSLGLLGSLLAMPAAPSEGTWRRWGRWALALGLYALALLSKEVAVLWPLAVVLWVRALGGASALGEERALGEVRALPETGPARRARWAGAAVVALPFAALAAVWFVVRLRILGRLQTLAPDPPGVLDLFVDIPRLLLFYLRQAVFPLWLGPSYPLRVGDGRDISWVVWLAGLALLLGLFAVGLQAARRDPRRAFSLGLFALPLLPALNVAAFHPEHVVHDRYLYLPLLGLLLWGGATVEGWNRSRRSGSRWVALESGPRWASTAGAVVLALWGLALSAQTVRYNRAWTSSLALWEWAVRSDPRGSSSWADLAQTHYRLGQLDQAAAAADRALELEPVTVALLTRAQVALARGRHAVAEGAARRVIDGGVDDPLAFDLLAIALQGQGRLGEAEAVLGDGIDRLPHRSCGFRSNRAVVRYLLGRKADALADLEGAVTRVGVEPTAPCLRSLFHLGNLYREQGRTEDADAAHRRFLAVTEGRRDADLPRLRRIATRAVAPGD